MDSAKTNPVVTPERLKRNADALLCLTTGREVAHAAGEWMAGAITLVDDPTFSMLISEAVEQWHRLEERIDDFAHMQRRRLAALQEPPRITLKPMEGLADEQ
jgi:hypothetical protein